MVDQRPETQVLHWQDLFSAALVLLQECEREWNTAEVEERENIQIRLEYLIVALQQVLPFVSINSAVLNETLENIRLLHVQWIRLDSNCTNLASVENGIVKGEALRILRTNPSKDTFVENISKFKRHLRDRGYPRNLVEKLLREIKFTRSCSVLKGKNKTQKDILPFVRQYGPSVSNLKQVLRAKWHLIQNEPLLRQIFKEPPIISYKKGKSLKDLLVRAKL